MVVHLALGAARYVTEAPGHAFGSGIGIGIAAAVIGLGIYALFGKRKPPGGGKK